MPASAPPPAEAARAAEIARRMAESVAFRHRRIVALKGPPPGTAEPLGEAPAILRAVIEGDGDRAEALAAIMYHCDVDLETAVVAVLPWMTGDGTG